MSEESKVPAFVKRFCGVQLMHLSVLLLLPIMLCESLRAPKTLFIDPDIWWHISNASILFTRHHFIWNEPYAYTVVNRQWLNPEWLSEIPFYFGFKFFGAFGIYLTTWALVYANVALVYFRSQRKSAPEAAFWASLVALLLFTVNSGPRTIMCGYILLTLLFLALDLFEERQSKAIWLVPVIFAVWVNTHGSWLLGMVLFVLYLVPGWIKLHAGAFEQDRRTAVTQKTLLIVLGLSILALFANPYGWHMVWNPFDMILKQKLNISTIMEWKPLNLDTILGKNAIVAIGIMLTAAMLKGRKWQIYEILWIVFAWYSAFDHVRFTFLAGVIVTPFLAMDFGRLIWSEPAKREFYSMNILFAVASLCFLVYMMPSPKRDTQLMNDGWPDSLIGMVQPSWRTLNEYEMGGRFIFDGKKDFVDSRVDTFEHAGVFGDYMKTIDIDDPFAVLDKYKIDHILFTEKRPFTYLVEHSPQWGVIKRDHEWVLLERKKRM